jgi:fibronectin type 3 domain-containing protein
MDWHRLSFQAAQKAYSPKTKRYVRLDLEELESRVLPSVNVLTYHNDAASTGQNLNEVMLTPLNVNQASFGEKFSVPVDGQVYAQPLIMTGVNITTGPYAGVHDVAFVATQHDSVYAIDANSGQILWQTSFINPAAGITTIPAADTGDTNDIYPEIGITSTPVIDSSTGTLYVEAATKEVRSDGAHYVQRLHALSIADGSEKFGGPVVIADSLGATYVSGPTVNGTGDASDAQGQVQFISLKQMNRPGLTLLNGNIYIAFASHGDLGPYHGWILGYSAATLQPTAVFNTTPNGSDGGIWQGGGSLTVDAQGNIYFETGNGSFNQSASNFSANGFPIDGDYGDSFVKVAVDTVHNSPANQNINGWGLMVVDYFTPFNQSGLNSGDVDLGSGGPMLLPDSAGSAAHPHLLVGAGKEGRIYLIDRDNMGKFNANTDNVVQEQANALTGSLDTAAYFNGSFYYVNGYGGYASAFSISNGAFSPASTSQSPDTYAFPGDTLSVSANGATNGIVWGVNRNANDLVAYDASNLANELYTSNQDSSRDALGAATKFNPPTVANGQVYVGTMQALVMYGLLAPTTTPPAAPLNLTAIAAGPSQINLTWTDGSTNQTGIKIERSTDDVNFTQIALTSANVTSFSDTGLAGNITYYYRVRATDPIGDSGYGNTVSASPSAPGSAVYVSDLNWVSATTGYGTVQKDKSVGQPTPATITIRGQTYAKGLGTHAVSDIIYNLGGNYASFISDVGIDDEVDGLGSVIFQVFADGVKIYDSGILTGTSAVQTVNVSVSGVQSLDLRVLNGVSGVSDDHADWAGARLIVGGTSAPAAPSGLTGTAASGTQVNLSWTNNSGSQTEFKVERSTDGVNFTQIALTAANVTTYMDTVLTPGATYSYRVRATNSIGDSPDSNTFTITLPTPPAAPTGAQVTLVAYNEVDLAWTNNATNANSYEVFRRTGVGNTFGLIATLPATATSYKDLKVAPNTQYFYQIQAFNVAGASGLAATSVTTPVQPTIVYVSDLNWVSATTGYGTVQKDLSVGQPTPQTITIRGQTYAKGIGTHAVSDIIYNLGGNYASFISDVGIDDEVNGLGSVIFQVFADGTKIYDSGVVTGTSPVQSINVSVAGVQSLDLRVINGVAGVNYDHADWAGARLVLAAVTAPNAPTGLTGTTPSATQVDLSWTNNSSNATGFKVLRSADGINFTQIALTAANVATYVDTAVTSGLTYSYVVRATNSAGDSANSNTFTVTMPAPTAVYVSDLNWVSATSGYGTVEKDKSVGQPTPTTITIRGQTYAKGIGTHAVSDIIYNLGGNYTSFISDVGIDDEVDGLGAVIFQVFADGTKIYDSGVLTGTSPVQTASVSVSGVQSLDLRVVAGASGINDDHADWAGARLVPIAAPAAPTNLVATGGNAQVALAWIASPGATSYNVYRGTTPNGEASTAVALVTSPSYTDTSVTNGTTYYYKVTAVNTAGQSPQSGEASATPNTVAPAAPTNLVATGGNAQVALAWSASTGAASYNVYRGTTSNGEASTAVASVTSPSYTDTSVTNGTTYYYKVTAVNSAGASPQSGEAAATPMPAQTVYLSDLNWVSATIGYGTVQKDKSVGQPTPATITIRGQTYAKGIGTHAVSDIIYNLGGNYATFISDVGIDDEVDGLGSVIFQVFADGTKIYDSGVVTGASPVQSIKVSVAGVQSLDLRVLNGVSGINDDHADWAGAQLIVAAVTAPAAPTNLVATGGNAQVALAWTASPGATSYNVYRGTTPNGESSSAVASVTSPSYTDTSVTNGTTYYYKVTAVNSAGASPQSGEASATPTANLVMIDSVSTGQAYNTTTAAVGVVDYIDRGYTITALSSALQNGTLIRTSNGDKAATAANLLTFTLSSPATVYVAYDVRETSLPAWLNDGTWTLTSDSVSTTDTLSGPMKVYSKTFAAGTVTLGGNLEAPAAGALSNYLVIVHT